LRHRLLQTPGEEIANRRKEDLSLAIGENYINKMFLFFLYFIYGCFYLSLNHKESDKILATEKEDEYKPGKIPLSYLPGVCNYLLFREED